MRRAPWSRLLMLAGLVAAAHWWAIVRDDARRPVAAVAPPAPVMVLAAAPAASPAADLPTLPPQQPSVTTPGVEAVEPATMTTPKPAAVPRAPPARRMPALTSAAAPGPRPADDAPATNESVVWLPGRPAPEVHERTDPVPPLPAAEPAPVTAAAPALEAAEPRAGELLAQAGAATRPVPASAAAAATSAEAPVPTYRTRPPAAATLSYRLSRGPIFGTGVIDWRPAGATYSLQLEGSVAVIGTLITQVSRGRIDATGLAPERHTDRRLRRSEQAANFDRAAGRIGFSGQAPELPWTPGVQDRVSVMIQLPAIVNAWARVPPVGEHVLIRVVGARGDSNVWSLRYEGRQAIDTSDGRVDALRFLREPEGPNDTRAEFWLDPQRQHLPVRMLLTDGKGDALELLRTP